jgi:DNA-directed RNA polymerase subunit N (RpoN/RPB10)
MIIPVKCVSCGTVLADKYQYYIREVLHLKLQKGMQIDKITYLTKTATEKTPEGEVMDKLGLNNVCCRRTMLTHVDIH